MAYARWTVKMMSDEMHVSSKRLVNLITRFEIKSQAKVERQRLFTDKQFNSLKRIHQYMSEGKSRAEILKIFEDESRPRNTSNPHTARPD